MSRPALLFAVFTEFHKLPHVKSQLKKDFSANVVSVLLTAEPEMLLARTELRDLTSEDRTKRSKSIASDLRFLQMRETSLADTYDYIIQNGNDRAIYDTVEELQRIVSDS